ncbi:MAG: MerR family transcriptional regulator [Armatimonadota bacterium]|nr:MerR family transcriptional regulator [Armatimonadota bacterium]MDR7563271.1 MerR family transcriptional regulator [Armatimonadota bacterium]MDR7602058.1 MerR family transcriptional regulator [Armatimonadota bacterium]
MGQRRVKTDTTPVYAIGIAAELLGVHPRTLRIYEEKGLIRPARRNRIRLFSDRDLQRVRLIQYLTREVGLNLAGVKLFLEIQDRYEFVADVILQSAGKRIIRERGE